MIWVCEIDSIFVIVNVLNQREPKWKSSGHIVNMDKRLGDDWWITMASWQLYGLHSNTTRELTWWWI